MLCSENGSAISVDFYCDFTHWLICIQLTFLAKNQTERVPELVQCFLLCSPYALSLAILHFLH